MLSSPLSLLCSLYLPWVCDIQRGNVPGRASLLRSLSSPHFTDIYPGDFEILLLVGTMAPVGGMNLLGSGSPACLVVLKISLYVPIPPLLCAVLTLCAVGFLDDYPSATDPSCGKVSGWLDSIVRSELVTDPLWAMASPCSAVTASPVSFWLPSVWMAFSVY